VAALIDRDPAISLLDMPRPTRVSTSRSRSVTPLSWRRLAVVGLSTRKLRAGLSAVGIAIGVAAIVAVLGLSSSSAAALSAEIAALGTNLLTVQPGQSFAGGTAELPIAAPAMISRLPGVYQVQSTGATGSHSRSTT
jgi:putative ABC transport system permease protein